MTPALEDGFRRVEDFVAVQQGALSMDAVLLGLLIGRFAASSG